MFKYIFFSLALCGLLSPVVQAKNCLKSQKCGNGCIARNLTCHKGTHTPRLPEQSNDRAYTNNTRMDIEYVIESKLGQRPRQGEILIYCWYDPLSGTPHMSGVPPIWYIGGNKSKDAPRTWVYGNANRLVDDTGYKGDNETAQRMRAKRMQIKTQHIDEQAWQKQADIERNKLEAARESKLISANMSPADVSYVMGTPRSITRDLSAGVGAIEIWHYKTGAVYFKNGKSYKQSMRVQ